MPLRAGRRRRRLSLTSLIDVIFLLLLFFMLSSTFSQFSEVALSTGATGGPPRDEPGEVYFVRLSGNTMTLNGRSAEPDELRQRLDAAPAPKAALISVAGNATAQQLTDVLVILRGIGGLSVSILDGA